MTRAHKLAAVVAALLIAATVVLLVARGSGDDGATGVVTERQERDEPKRSLLNAETARQVKERDVGVLRVGKAAGRLGWTGDRWQVRVEQARDDTVTQTDADGVTQTYQPASAVVGATVTVKTKRRYGPVQAAQAASQILSDPKVGFAAVEGDRSRLIMMSDTLVAYETRALPGKFVIRGVSLRADCPKDPKTAQGSLAVACQQTLPGPRQAVGQDTRALTDRQIEELRRDIEAGRGPRDPRTGRKMTLKDLDRLANPQPVRQTAE